MKRSSLIITAVAACAGAIAFAATPLIAADPPLSAPSAPGPADAPGYAGTQICADCHTAEARAWRGSQHDLAMQPATAETVLGDFEDASIEHFGVTTTFSRDGDRLMVRSEGSDGAIGEFTVDYVFGIDPLQQVLIGMPDGRLQALGIAWDTRAEDAGGQRWFHLYPDQRIAWDDPLHWTSRNQTWNWMCAGCHSTGLRRGYDASTDAYATRWVEIDVGCESCHGPGSDHVVWAKSGADRHADPAAGLKVALSRGGSWHIQDYQRGIAELVGEDRSAGTAQIETCAACHSRRRPLTDGHHPGASFFDDFVPALLEEGLYYPDGQILDEVYVWGSYVQSAMYQEGVVCSDCHDPHTATLRAEGNAVCGQCHLPARFDTPDHHHHPAGSEAAQCVACHMPAKTYMVVDPRRDHSFRVPRPDLASMLGTPDVCTGCHGDRDSSWAQSRLDDWYGEGLPSRPQFAAAIHAGRTGAPGAWTQLADLAGDESQPAIARATALSLLSRYTTWLNPDMAQAISLGLEDSDPLVRLAATEVLSALPLAQTAELLFARLNDPVRAVRIAAARQLTALPPQQVPVTAALALDRATAELEASFTASAERPETLVNLGDLETTRRRWDAAETAYRRAIALDGGHVLAYANLADLMRSRGKEAAAESLLRQALKIAPDAAALHHALGLSLVRARRYGDATDELKRAWDLAPENARFGYVYAVALDSTGAPEQSVDVLSSVVDRHPTDRASREALIQALIRQGELEAARHQASAMVRMAPDDRRAREILSEVDRIRQ